MYRLTCSNVIKSGVMPRTLGKASLAKLIDEKLNLWNANLAYNIVLSLLECIVEVLKTNKKLTVSRFGTFYVLHKKPRKGRNPRTGEAIILPERYVVKFRPSSILKSLCDN